MTIDLQGITDALVSHAQLIGKFDKVSTHEPTTAPATGMTCAVWPQALGPLATQSGLSATTAYLVMQIRVYDSVLRQTPDEADQIDPRMLTAVSDLMESLTGEFTLSVQGVEAVDLLGMGGQTLTAESGYVQIGGQGAGLYRIMTITVPLILSDAWSQVA